MRSIGVRELRQRASEYLRLVKRGETVEVTERGRPIARIVGVHAGPPQGALEQLETEGRLTPDEGDVLELGPPLAPRRGVASPSRALLGIRDEER